MRLRIARRVEVGTAREQRDGDEARRNRSVTETVLEMKRDEPEQHGQRHLPRALLPACKPARSNEEYQA